MHPQTCPPNLPCLKHRTAKPHPPPRAHSPAFPYQSSSPTSHSQAPSSPSAAHHGTQSSSLTSHSQAASQTCRPPDAHPRLARDKAAAQLPPEAATASQPAQQRSHRSAAPVSASRRWEVRQWRAHAVAQTRVSAARGVPERCLYRGWRAYSKCALKDIQRRGA